MEKGIWSCVNHGIGMVPWSRGRYAGCWIDGGRRGTRSGSARATLYHFRRTGVRRGLLQDMHDRAGEVTRPPLSVKMRSFSAPAPDVPPQGGRVPVLLGPHIPSLATLPELQQVLSLSNTIDIIIPVYRDFEVTRRCVESVLASSSVVGHRLVIVDDCSPEPDLRDWLQVLSSRGRLDLVTNACNEGFVRSVNKAMALHGDRDAVLLNSDCEVSGDWLDRLCRIAESDASIGTITPFSNNATICSYPICGEENPLPPGWALSELDRLAARVNPGARIDLPTAVGSCMFIRRACWEEVGGFDAETFGHGYGEECDFSMRARNAGWRNVLAANVFVFHQGSVSFGAARSERVARAEALVQARHPDYGPSVMHFLEADPASPFRAAISRARAARGHADACGVAEELMTELTQQRAFLRGQIANCTADLASTREVCRTLETELAAARQAYAELGQALERAEDFVREREADLIAVRAECDGVIAERDNILAELQVRRRRSPTYLIGRLLDRLGKLKNTLRD